MPALGSRAWTEGHHSPAEVASSCVLDQLLQSNKFIDLFCSPSYLLKFKQFEQNNNLFSSFKDLQSTQPILLVLSISISLSGDWLLLFKTFQKVLVPGLRFQLGLL